MVGGADFIERFVLDDDFFHDSFASTTKAYVTEGTPLLHGTVAEPLTLWALCLAELNAFFNPRDGRRLTGARKQSIHERDEDAGELQEELFDAGDAGPCGVPAPNTEESACSGYPRVACRSRWLDTLITMMPLENEYL